MSRRISLTALEFTNKLNKFVNSVSDENTNKFQRQLAKRAMKQIIQNDITKRQKEVILLYYYENKNIPEIAKMLGLNKSSVARALTRARKNILERMKYYF